MANFLLDLLANTAEGAEVVGIEQAMEAHYTAHPEDWPTDVAVATAFAALVNKWEAGTKSGFLKKLEEGLVTAVGEEAAKHPVA